MENYKVSLILLILGLILSIYAFVLIGIVLLLPALAQSTGWLFGEYLLSLIAGMLVLFIWVLYNTEITKNKIEDIEPDKSMRNTGLVNRLSLVCTIIGLVFIVIAILAPFFLNLQVNPGGPGTFISGSVPQSVAYKVLGSLRNVIFLLGFVLFYFGVILRVIGMMIWKKPKRLNSMTFRSLFAIVIFIAIVAILVFYLYYNNQITSIPVYIITNYSNMSASYLSSNYTMTHLQNNKYVVHLTVINSAKIIHTIKKYNCSRWPSNKSLRYRNKFLWP
jgi:hypothetical protein